MLIIDIFGLVGSLALLLCAMLCVFAIRKGRLRRIFKRLLLARILQF
jgi:hypothetical protein